jgi:hypothetical protein
LCDIQYKDSSEDKSLTLYIIQNATGGQRILDPSKHNAIFYLIIAHAVIVNNQTTNAAFGYGMTIKCRLELLFYRQQQQSQLLTIILT